MFKTVVKDISQDFPPLGESGSEFSNFIPEPRNFSEVKILSDDIRKPWLKATLKEMNNLINDRNFLVEGPYKDEPVTPCMDVYKAKIQYDGSLDNFKLIIGDRGNLQNKGLVGDNWSPTASMRILKYFLADSTKHKAIVHQFVKLYSRYIDYFPSYTT